MRYLAAPLIWAYRVVGWQLSASFGTSCKYHPSCSQYAIDALRHYGFVRGATLAAWRLLRCNPWSSGGVDYAENQTLFERRAAGERAPSRREGLERA